jgi:antitoxin component of MazEF toxin-antitoxin module
VVTTTKLVRHNGSLAIVLDDALLNAAHLAEDSEVRVGLEGNRIIIHCGEVDDATLTKAFQKTVERYGTTLERLAD